MIIQSYRSSIILVILLLGLMLTLALAYLIYQTEYQNTKIELADEIEALNNALSREFYLSIEGPMVIKSLFVEDREVSEVEFKTTAKDIIERRGNILAMLWAPKVNHADRDSFIKKLHSINPSYQLKDLNEDGELVVAKQHNQYFPVLYHEPYTSLAGYGLNLTSNQKTKPNLYDAIATGRPQASGFFDLPLHHDVKAFLVYVPAFKSPYFNVQQRKENVTGLVITVFNIKDIFTSALISEKYLNYKIEIIDNSNSAVPETAFIYSVMNNNEKLANNFSIQQSVKFLNRNLLIKATPSANYLRSRISNMPYTILFLGTFLTLISCFYLHNLVQHTLRVEQKINKRTKELNDANKRLSEISFTDGLTRIANRRQMDIFLLQEWHRAARENTLLSFALIDIDFFKNYNDKYGHLKGDDCLKRVASILKEQICRPCDIVARYGGEEFALVLPNTNDASAVAERCCHAVANAQIEHRASEIAEFVTISIGVCTALPANNVSTTTLVSCADKQLYQAKSAGRNCVKSNSVNCRSLSLTTELTTS